MRAEVISAVDSNPAVIVVGVFDPFTEEHRQLLTNLAAYARDQRLRAVGIILDPRPAAIIQGRDGWPVYHDFAARVVLFKTLGINGIVRVVFGEEDVESGVTELLEVISSVVNVAELWIGAAQSLGTGLAGCQNTILRVTSEKGILCKVLPVNKWRGLSAGIIQTMRQEGDVESAIQVSGLPPIFLNHAPFSTVFNLNYA
jgi:FAD synthase